MSSVSNLWFFLLRRVLLAKFHDPRLGPESLLAAFLRYKSAVPAVLGSHKSNVGVLANRLPLECRKRHERIVLRRQYQGRSSNRRQHGQGARSRVVTVRSFEPAEARRDRFIEIAPRADAAHPVE